MIRLPRSGKYCWITLLMPRRTPFEYRILFLSVETLGELKLTREDLQERNPAFGALFKRVEACIKAGVLQGDAFAVSTVLWTAAHGAASLLITAQNFPFGSRQAIR